jgi:hypothetical protein
MVSFAPIIFGVVAAAATSRLVGLPWRHIQPLDAARRRVRDKQAFMPDLFKPQPSVSVG